MFLFGHTGVTLGAAVLLSGTLNKNRTLTKNNELQGQPQSLYGLPASQNGYLRGITAWLFSLASRIDIRLLLVGSLLPDIIDKPIGRVFFMDVFNSGRIFAHTLLFLTILILGSLYIYQHYKKTWLLVLSFGTLTHLVLDQMWLYPRNLLWPLYGLSFDMYATVDLSSWLRDIFHELLANPAMYIPELVGAGIIVWFVLLLVRRKKLAAFIRNGQV